MPRKLGNPERQRYLKKMNKLYILIFIFIAGCSNPNQISIRELELDEVKVPEKYRLSSASEVPGVWPDDERYVHMYKQGKWLIIEEYAKNINFIKNPNYFSDHTIGGWPSAMDGLSDGIENTDTIVKMYIATLGKDKMQKYLKEIYKRKR